MDQPQADQQTDSTTASGQALGERHEESSDRVLGPGFARGGVLDLRDAARSQDPGSPRPDRSTFPTRAELGELRELAERLEEALAVGSAALASRLEQPGTDGDVALTERVGRLAARLNVFAHEGILARGALDVLTTSLEDQLDHLSQTRTSLDGLAGVVERHRTDREAMAAQLDTVDAAHRAARDTNAAALDRLTAAVVVSRARITAVEQAIARLRAGPKDGQGHVEPLLRGRAGSDTRIPELQVDERLAALEAEVARAAADNEQAVLTLRAELEAVAARADDLARVVARQVDELARLRAQVRALTSVPAPAKTVLTPPTR